MNIVSGYVTRADGERFGLSIDGEERTFRLGLDAVVDVDLRGRVGSDEIVTVHYDDIPDETTHVAYRVFIPPMPSGPRESKTPLL